MFGPCPVITFYLGAAHIHNVEMPHHNEYLRGALPQSDICISPYTCKRTVLVLGWHYLHWVNYHRQQLTIMLASSTSDLSFSGAFRYCWVIRQVSKSLCKLIEWSRGRWSSHYRIEPTRRQCIPCHELSLISNTWKWKLNYLEGQRTKSAWRGLLLATIYPIMLIFICGHSSLTTPDPVCSWQLAIGSLYELVRDYTHAWWRRY